MIFLDTSAVLALADTRDSHHTEAVASLEAMMSEGHLLLTHNYVLVESAALLQSRLGPESSMTFLSDAERFTVHWVSPADHAEAVKLLQTRNQRGLSLVDCMNCVVMRLYAVNTALAFNADFEADGFEIADLREDLADTGRGPGTGGSR